MLAVAPPRAPRTLGPGLRRAAFVKDSISIVYCLNTICGKSVPISIVSKPQHATHANHECRDLVPRRGCQWQCLWLSRITDMRVKRLATVNARTVCCLHQAWTWPCVHIHIHRPCRAHASHITSTIARLSGTSLARRYDPEARPSQGGLGPLARSQLPLVVD